MNRRDFVATAAALAGATPLQTPRAPAAKGTVVLFQGDSITDCGRDRSSGEANSTAALGTGYPLLVTSAVLAAQAQRALSFFNRGISGNKVPDLQQRWTWDALE